MDELSLIQVGITLADEHGNLASPISTWQFNVRFNLEKDASVSDSIELLKNAGIDFEKMACYGIDSSVLAEYLITCNIVLNENIKWLTFHGAFDLAYLLKILLNDKLPASEAEFMKNMNIFFPYTYDIKYMVKDIENLKYVSLQKMGTDLEVLPLCPFTHSPPFC